MFRRKIDSCKDRQVGIPLAAPGATHFTDTVQGFGCHLITQPPRLYRKRCGAGGNGHKLACTDTGTAGTPESAGTAGKEFSIKVYSNASGLTLYHNGRQVSRKTSPDDPAGVVWTFSGLKLKEDTDVFRVVASDGTSDEVSLSRL